MTETFKTVLFQSCLPHIWNIVMHANVIQIVTVTMHMLIDVRTNHVCGYKQPRGTYHKKHIYNNNISIVYISKNMYLPYQDGFLCSNENDVLVR